MPDVTATETIGYSLAKCEVLTSLSRATLYRAMKAGDLESVSLGRRRVVLRDDLEAFLKRHRGRGDAA